jgi:4,5-dihydroxyphthalate decarboxylase
MDESKRQCIGQMRFSGAIRYTLPWLYDDLDEIDGVFGGDPWPYGLEANRVNLETLQRYLIDQGLAKEARPLEELFTPVIERGT